MFEMLKKINAFVDYLRTYILNKNQQKPNRENMADFQTRKVKSSETYVAATGQL